MSSMNPNSEAPSLRSVMQQNGITPPPAHTQNGSASGPGHGAPAYPPQQASPPPEYAQQYPPQAVRPTTHYQEPPPPQPQPAPQPAPQQAPPQQQFPQQVNMHTPRSPWPQQPVPEEQASQPQQQAPSGNSHLAEQFRARGFNVPDGLSEEEIYDTVGYQLDEANRIRRAQEQQQFQPAPGMRSPQPPQQQSPAPMPSVGAEQATGEPSRKSTKVSEEAQALARTGMITRTDSGWEASNPAFSQFADELNNYEARRQATLAKLADDPETFFNDYAREVGFVDKNTVEQMRQELEQLKQQLQTQSQSSVDGEFTRWVDSNRHMLFDNGDPETGRLLPYAQKYNEFYEHVSQMARDLGQQLSPGQAHRRTLALMKSAGQALQAPPQQQGYSAPPPQQPQQSFMQQAASSPPRSPHNRLVEYPAQQPSGEPYVPQGKQGYPSLRGIISQIQNAT